MIYILKNIGKGKIGAGERQIFGNDLVSVENRDLSEKEVLEASPNLFDKTKRTDGAYLSKAGILVEDPAFYLTDFMPIEGGKTYSKVTPQNKFFNFYDSEKNRISSGDYTTDVLAPQDAAFIRTALRYSESPVDEFMFAQKEKMPTSYQPFGVLNTIKEKYLNNVVLRSLLNKPGGVPVINSKGFLPDQFIEFTRPSTNLFDPSARLDGFYVNTSGIEVEQPDFYATDYIPVTAGKTYTKSSVGLKYYALYDENKNYLSGGQMEPSVDVIQNGFLRTSERYTAFDPNEFQVCEGAVLPPFEPYGVIILEEKVGNWPRDQASYIGEILTVLGDSISYGFIPRNYPGYPGQLNSYANLAAQKLGMIFQNKGISGSTVGAQAINDQTNAPFVYRYQDLDNAAKFVLVMGATNDIRKGIPLGTINDSDETTFYGALHVLCLGLLQKYRHDQGVSIGQTKKIVLCTPIKLLNTDISAYAQAVRDIGDYYSIPVWDAYKFSGINPHILRTVQGYEAGYTEMYNPYITDGTHPTQEGHEMMANSLVGFLKSI